MFSPVIRASIAVPIWSPIPPASSTTMRRFGAWIPWSAASLYWAGANPNAQTLLFRFHSVVRQSPSSWCLAWRVFEDGLGDGDGVCVGVSAAGVDDSGVVAVYAGDYELVSAV